MNFKLIFSFQVSIVMKYIFQKYFSTSNKKKYLLKTKLKFSFNYELFFKGTFLTINIKKFDSIAIESKQ